jgi:hypothetical protein
MELVLVPAIVLVVMYATMRSPAAGLVAGAGVTALVAPTGEQSHLLFAAAVASAGLLVGWASRGRALASRAILLGAVPVALAVAVRVPEREALEEQLDQTLRLQFGDELPPEARDQMVSLQLELIPAVAALVGVGLVFLSYAVAVRLFPRLGSQVREIGQLARLRLPFATVWSFAVSLLLCVVGRSLGPRWLLSVGINLVVVHGAAFFVEGLAIGRHALVARAIPGLVQWVLGLSALLIVPMQLIVMGLGLLDLWFDFRRLLAPPQGGDGPVEGG